MEAKTTLVGADCGVELNPVSAVYMILAVIVDPGNAEADHSLRLHKLFDNTLLFVFGVLVNNQIETFQNLQNSLMELALIGVASDDLCINTL
jgi:hypothetical protein